MLILAFLSVLAQAVVGEDPNTALSGVYSNCVLGLDWSCLQRRTLLFVDRLARVTSYPLFPGLLLVRTAPTGPSLDATDLSSLDGDNLGEMMDSAVELFFEEHVVRVELPDWLKSEGRAMGHVDFFLGDGVEGRKKKKKKKKLIKKLLLGGVLLLVAKLALLAPLLLGLIKIAAIKGLLFGLISIIISKVMILKKLMKSKKMGMMMGMGGGGWMPSSSGGGGGGGWPSSGSGGGGGGGGGGGSGSGWDRSLSAHQMAYSAYDDKSNGT